MSIGEARSFRYALALPGWQRQAAVAFARDMER